MSKRTQTAHELDRRLKELATRARRAEAELAAALLEMKRRGLFKVLGFARIQDYAESELDLSRGKAKELVELAARLEKLPKIRAAFAEGEVPWTKARQIARVATDVDEETWIERARTLTNRGLERVVAAAKGEKPVVRVMLELSASDAADVDQAVKMLREERGEALPVAEAVAELCRRAMGSPVDRPGYQVVIHACPRCDSASRDARDGDVAVSKEELAAAKEDAEIVDLERHVTRKSITPRERREVIARDRGRCALCGVTAWLHLHHVAPEGGVKRLCLLCSACHKGLVHGGHVVVEGEGGAWRFRLADGSKAADRAASPDGAGNCSHVDRRPAVA